MKFLNFRKHLPTNKHQDLQNKTAYLWHGQFMPPQTQINKTAQEHIRHKAGVNRLQRSAKQQQNLLQTSRFTLTKLSAS